MLSVKIACLIEHHKDRRQGSNSMANTCELLINVVKDSKSYPRSETQRLQTSPTQTTLDPEKKRREETTRFPTMKDRAMQALYLQALDPVVETMSDPNSYGFRKGRSPHDALEAFKKIGVRRMKGQQRLKVKIAKAKIKILNIFEDLSSIKKGAWHRKATLQNHIFYKTLWLGHLLHAQQRHEALRLLKQQQL